MPARHPPSARARQLAAELRRLRAATTLTGDEVATRLGWSPSKLSRIETGQATITTQDLQRLLDMYEVSGPLRNRLVELGAAASQRGWWDAYDDLMPNRYSAFLALENDAESEFTYTQMLIPGLLQTEAYAREILGSLNMPPGEVTRRVTVRLARARLLTKDNPLKLFVVLDEACLRRRMGDATIMAGQISHLVAMARLPNVTLQVLPFSAGYHEGLISAFRVLHFPEEEATDVVYLENMTSDIFIEQEGEVYRYIRAFAGIRELALGPQESIDVLLEISQDIEQQLGD